MRAKIRGKSKYKAIRTTVDGITFASKKEAARYAVLKIAEKAGEIRNLERQPRFKIFVPDSPLMGNETCWTRVCDYVADFSYEVPGLVSNPVIEDVKGFKTPVYRLKKKLVEAQYGIRVVEV